VHACISSASSQHLIPPPFALHLGALRPVTAAVQLVRDRLDLHVVRTLKESGSTGATAAAAASALSTEHAPDSLARARTGVRRPRVMARSAW